MNHGTVFTDGTKLCILRKSSLGRRPAARRSRTNRMVNRRANVRAQQREWRFYWRATPPGWGQSRNSYSRQTRRHVLCGMRATASLPAH